jgi:hypothetical protein
VVVPFFLLLIARDLLLYDPPRVLAWRLFHEPRLADVPPWLLPLIPRPTGAFDRDPVALLLGGFAAALAVAYLIAALAGARTRLRGALVASAAVALVVVPTLAFIAMGSVTGRPYGQDGGVVQLPLAIDKILAGQSPYGADYSDSILGKQARVSEFWAAYGGNPILRHHAYLPGTHLLMMPFHVVGRALTGGLDPRLVTLLFSAFAAFLAARLVTDPGRRLAAVALVVLNPLVYWHQIFGANDVVVVALVLWAVRLAERGHPTLAGAITGLACATKQLAWPFAPFLLAALSGAGSLRELAGREALTRVARPVLAALAVFTLVVLPVAALDFEAFWGDIVVYNVGLPGGDNYPLGGTPGFGFANFLLYSGAVQSLRDHFPFGVFYLLLVPVGVLLLRHQLRDGAPATVLVTGSAALLASLYFSRVVHPNYLVLAATLLPLGALQRGRLPADVVVVPLLLLGLAVEVAEHQVLRTTWADAVNAGLPQLPGVGALSPRAGPGVTDDPLGLALSATAAGLAIGYLLAGVFSLRETGRLRVVMVAVLAVVVLPTLAVAGVGRLAGQTRSQHPWSTTVLKDAHWRAGALERPVPLEAWSTSFRRDPPGPALGGWPPTPGTDAVSALLSRLLVFDPRILAIAALFVVLALLRHLAPLPAAPTLTGAAVLAPVTAIGLAFGSGDVLVLAAALGALVLARRGWVVPAAAVVGAAAAVFPRVLFAAPFLLLPPRPDRRRLIETAAGLLIGLVALSAPLLLSSPPLFLETLVGTPVLPGVGLVNVALYWGLDGSEAARWVFLLAPWVVGALAWIVRIRSWSRGNALAQAAVALLLGMVVSSGASAHDLVAPMALLLLAATEATPARTDDGVSAAS